MPKRKKPKANRDKTPDRLAKLLRGTRAGEVEHALTARSERVNIRLSPLEKAALDDLCHLTGIFRAKPRGRPEAVAGVPDPGFPAILGGSSLFLNKYPV